MLAVRKFSDEQGQAYFRSETVEGLPAPGPGEIQIKIHCIGVCTSDVHVLHGAMQMPDGNIVGHEFSGEIVTSGPDCDNSLQPGQKVICELAVDACFDCPVCDSGHYEFCPHKRPPGWASQGVYTEYINMPQHCVMPVDDVVPYPVAALAEPMAICTYGVIERGQIDSNDLTVIYGMGPIGLLSLIMLQDLGMQRIVCVTPVHNGRQRYDLAKSLGCEHVYSTDADIAAVLAELSDSGQADTVIDCSGAPSAINQGIELLKKGGRFIALGIAGEETIPFAFNQALLKALHVVFSCTSSHHAWELSRGILERRHADIARLITHQVPLSEWQTAYRAIEDRSAIKAVLYNQ